MRGQRRRLGPTDPARTATASAPSFHPRRTRRVKPTAPPIPCPASPPTPKPKPYSGIRGRAPRWRSARRSGTTGAGAPAPGVLFTRAEPAGRGRRDALAPDHARLVCAAPRPRRAWPVRRSRYGFPITDPLAATVVGTAAQVSEPTWPRPSRSGTRETLVFRGREVPDLFWFARYLEVCGRGAARAGAARVRHSRHRRQLRRGRKPDSPAAPCIRPGFMSSGCPRRCIRTSS